MLHSVQAVKTVGTDEKLCDGGGYSGFYTKLHTLDILHVMHKPVKVERDKALSVLLVSVWVKQQAPLRRAGKYLGDVVNDSMFDCERDQDHLVSPTSMLALVLFTTSL